MLRPKHAKWERTHTPRQVLVYASTTCPYDNVSSTNRAAQNCVLFCLLHSVCCCRSVVVGLAALVLGRAACGFLSNAPWNRNYKKKKLEMKQVTWWRWTSRRLACTMTRLPRWRLINEDNRLKDLVPGIRSELRWWTQMEIDWSVIKMVVSIVNVAD